MWFLCLESQVPQVRQANLDLLDLPDPLVRVVKDCQGLRDHLAHLDLLATQQLESQALQVDQANQVQMVHLDLKEILVHPVLRDQGVLLDLLAALGLPVYLPRANLDQLVCLDQWDQEESQVLRDIQVFLVHQDKKETEVLAFKGHQVSQVRQVHLVVMGHLVLWDQLDQKATLELLELEYQVNQVKMGLQDCQVLQDLKVLREHQEHLVLLVVQVMWVQAVLRVQEVSQVRRELQVKRVKQVQWGLKALRDIREIRGHRELRANQATQVQQAHKAQGELQVLQVAKEILARQVQLVLLEQLDLLDLRVIQEILDHLVKQGLQVPQGQEELLVLLVHQVHQELKVTLVFLAHLVLQVLLLKEFLDRKVHQDFLDQMVPLVKVDYLDLLAHLVLLIPGVYYFSYSMHVNGANALAALYKNEDPVMFTYDEYNKGFLDQMSGSAVLQLNEQDTVYVQIPDDEANGVFAADNVHCSFSGFLIAST
ncbi:hypothetical protein PGIGA_G00021010 [Pangasianodon gigas]|uniref:Uncharacterized protein n=1 Tax=Pangasianodon gigas TaxID=30993 RepID=A0ACC5WUZ5_PANGG|nr:hypothetical protein [Pangasianodon gigas]